MNTDLSRREFLLAGGAAAATLAVFPCSAFAVEPSAKKIRSGVLGGGFGCKLPLARASQLYRRSRERPSP